MKVAGADAVDNAEGHTVMLKTQGAARGPEHDGPAGVEDQGMCTGVAQEPGRSRRLPARTDERAR